MKYCPYCGVELVDSAAPFCSECGMRITSSKSDKRDSKQAESEQFEYIKGYDGYYEDILPEDDTEIKQGLDRNTIKNLTILIIAVLLVIGLSIIALFFL